MRQCDISCIWHYRVIFQFLLIRDWVVIKIVPIRFAGNCTSPLPPEVPRKSVVAFEMSYNVKLPPLIGFFDPGDVHAKRNKSRRLIIFYHILRVI